LEEAMKKLSLAFAVGFAFGGLAAAPALAHHSHAMFDTSKTIDISGTVKGYQFANPHVYLLLIVPKDGGEQMPYSVEMAFTSHMLEDGIGPKTFKVGDKVHVQVWPARNGGSTGSYVGAIDAQGGKHGSFAGKPG
jgi:hypothetical protein